MTPIDSSRFLFDFERALVGFLGTRYPGDDIVSQTVRYAMAGGGKRVRPLLCLMVADAIAGDHKAALPAAIAIEFVHSYSLVHDDLPCMDDDDIRRGRPTAHKVFGESQALLGGDALLTDAFTIVSEGRPDPASQVLLPPETRLGQVRELAEAAGGSGMVLGQSLDLYWTARSGASRADLDEVHLRKTGFLLGAAAAMGALAGGAPAATVTKFRDFGRLLGLAFQVLDDLLDDSTTTGKSAGKDKAKGKLTYLALMSPDEARGAADLYTAQALAALDGTGARLHLLMPFAQNLLKRER